MDKDFTVFYENMFVSIIAYHKQLRFFSTFMFYSHDTFLLYMTG